MKNSFIPAKFAKNISIINIDLLFLFKEMTMPDNNTLLAVSAISGLAGAAITQGIGAITSFFNDKRKFNNELQSTYRSKKMEIGDTFYQATAENLTFIRKHIVYWKRREYVKSKASVDFLNRELEKLKKDMDRLNKDSVRNNLIHLYYNIKLTTEALNESNTVSQNHYLKFLDTIDALKDASDEETQEELLGKYALILFDMCNHYEKLYQQMEQDMQTVKDELLKEFSIA